MVAFDLHLQMWLYCRGVEVQIARQPKTKAFTEGQFREAVTASISVAGVLRCLELGVSGTNYRIVHREIERQHLDTSHWMGQAHLKGKSHFWSKRCDLAEILVANSKYRSTGGLKSRLLKEGLLSSHCAHCGLNRWNGRPLVLEIDHINGVGDDNRIENLRLLCPNCHSQTEYYCGRNVRVRSPREQRFCETCRAHVSEKAKRCISCAAMQRRSSRPHLTKIVWPPLEELQLLIAQMPMTTVARRLGVSDNAVRKHLKQKTKQ